MPPRCVGCGVGPRQRYLCRRRYGGWRGHRGGLLVLIAWAVIRIFPERRGGERPEVRDQPAEEILRGRFARGEIDAEEYERSLEVLRNGRSSLKGGV